jgi:hypothetical protein
MPNPSSIPVDSKDIGYAFGNIEQFITKIDE